MPSTLTLTLKEDFIYSAIVEWYGSTEAFTEYVRGPLREDKVRVSRWPEVEDVRKSRKYYFQMFMTDLRVIHGASVTVFSFGFCCSCIGLAERGAKRSGSEGSGPWSLQHKMRPKP